MFTQRKTVDDIVKQFTTMAGDLDKILEEEANSVESMSIQVSALESNMNESLNTSKRAMKIKKNLLALVQ